MADNKQVWSAFNTTLTDLSATNVLQNLSSAAAKLLTVIDNTSAPRYRLGAFEFYLRFQSAPSAGAVVAVYFLLALDGTNYEDGSDSGPVLPAKPASIVCPVRAVTTQQKIDIPAVWLPPMKIKPLLYNSAGQALTNTAGENLLGVRLYSPMIE